MKIYFQALKIHFQGLKIVLHPCKEGLLNVRREFVERA